MSVAIGAAIVLIFGIADRKHADEPTGSR
jgi:hypothetical protein